MDSYRHAPRSRASMDLRTVAPVTRAWMVRAGTSGEREAVSIRESLTIAGWPEVGDLSQCPTWEDLRLILDRTYPRENPRVIANWRGQLWRFLAVMQPQDLVVMP